MQVRNKSDNFSINKKTVISHLLIFLYQHLEQLFSIKVVEPELNEAEKILWFNENAKLSDCIHWRAVEAEFMLEWAFLTNKERVLSGGCL